MRPGRAPIFLNIFFLSTTKRISTPCRRWSPVPSLCSCLPSAPADALLARRPSLRAPLHLSRMGPMYSVSTATTSAKKSRPAATQHLCTALPTSREKLSSPTETCWSRPNDMHHRELYMAWLPTTVVQSVPSIDGSVFMHVGKVIV